MNEWLAKLFECDQLTPCMRACVNVWVGQLSPGRSLHADLSTQPLPNPRAKCHSRSVFLPCVERSEEGGNLQQLCSCHKVLFSQRSGNSFPPSPVPFSLFACLQDCYTPLPLPWYLSWHQPGLLVKEPMTSLSLLIVSLLFFIIFIYLFLARRNSHVLYLQVLNFKFSSDIQKHHNRISS